LEEKRNPGSEGNRAELSVSKGKDLFSTGEDPNALVFGREKQTASDPNDLRALKRLITRPFSESVSPISIRKRETVDDLLSEAIERTKKIDGIVKKTVSDVLKITKKS
jgi:hypothetical protein